MSTEQAPEVAAHRLRELRIRGDLLSRDRQIAEFEHGQDSPQERRLLERATDVAAESEMLEDWLDGIE